MLLGIKKMKSLKSPSIKTESERDLEEVQAEVRVTGLRSDRKRSDVDLAVERKKTGRSIRRGAGLGEGQGVRTRTEGGPETEGHRGKIQDRI